MSVDNSSADGGATHDLSYEFSLRDDLVDLPTAASASKANPERTLVEFCTSTDSRICKNARLERVKWYALHWTTI